MTKILNAKSWWKTLLIFATIFSFALLKSFDCSATYATYGIVWTILIPLATGLFFWLIFEVLIGFWYAGIKDKMPSELTSAQFLNLSRFFIIFLNIILFFIYKLILLFNFFPNFIILLFNLIFNFIYILTIYLILKKIVFKGPKIDKKFELLFFSFGFLFLFMDTILWGVL